MKAFTHSRLKKLGLECPIMVAPMVGISHVAFRELVRRYLPKGVSVLTFTEMLSTRRLPSDRLDKVDELKIADDETFFVPQLLGNEESFIRDSIRKLTPLRPWGYDINMGCPVSHVLRHNWGVRLMGDKTYAAEVVGMVRRHTDLPLSVKMRLSPHDHVDEDYLFGFTETLEKAGCDWLTIHARLPGNHHSGAAHWDAVARVAKERSIPIAVNGDVQSASDIAHLLEELQIDGVMLARSVTARPWIIWQLCHRLGITETPEGYEGQNPPTTPEEEGREYMKACFTMMDLLTEHFADDTACLKRFKFFAANGSKWLKFGHDLWSHTTKAKSMAHLRDIMHDYSIRVENPMYHRIDLW